MLFKKETNLIKKYYKINRKILKEANKYYKLKVYDFESVKVEKRDVGFLAEIANPILKELHSYYNNELCLTLAMAKAFVDNSNQKELTSFHFENSIFRIVSFWDYSLSMLNEYLNFGFHTDTIAKEKATYYAGKKAVYEKREGYYELHYVDLDEDEKKEKHKEVKNIKVISDKAMFEKYKKNHYPTERLNKYFELLNSEKLRELKKIRNQIIHTRSLGTNMMVKFSHLHMKNAISNSKKGWIDYNHTFKLIEENLNNIHEALICLSEIINLDEFPNFVDTGDRKFYMYDIVCSKCGFEDRIPASLVNDNGVKVCHSCWDNEMIIREKLRTNEINHGSALYNYSKYLIDSSQ